MEKTLLFLPIFFLLIQASSCSLVQKLLATDAMVNINAKLVPMPGCDNLDIASEKYCECLARRYTQTIWDPVGTCKMGPKSDSLAVVDPELRVYGVKKLRVCDGSVIPTLTTGNTNAPITMIAEKAADLIKRTCSSCASNAPPPPPPPSHKPKPDHDKEKDKVFKKDSKPSNKRKWFKNKDNRN